MNVWAIECAEQAYEGWLKLHLSLGFDLFLSWGKLIKLRVLICPQLTNVSCNDYLSHYRWRSSPDRGTTTKLGAFQRTRMEETQILFAMRQSVWTLPSKKSWCKRCQNKLSPWNERWKEIERKSVHLSEMKLCERDVKDARTWSISSYFNDKMTESGNCKQLELIAIFFLNRTDLGKRK